jgi:hypothetical protein
MSCVGNHSQRLESQTLDFWTVRNAVRDGVLVLWPIDVPTFKRPFLPFIAGSIQVILSRDSNGIVCRWIEPQVNQTCVA